MADASHVQVILASGPDEPKRVVLGLSLAASAAAAGKQVSLFLAMDGAQCLLDEVCNRSLVDGYPSVAELLGAIAASGGAIEYCPHCLPIGCTPRFGAEHPHHNSCGCSGNPAGIASYGVNLGDSATLVI